MADAVDINKIRAEILQASTLDYLQPQKAEEKLKERLRAVTDALGLKGKDLNKLCIVFADESSPQLQANFARISSLQKGLINNLLMCNDPSLMLKIRNDLFHLRKFGAQVGV